MFGIAPTRIGALGRVELREVLICLPLKPVQVPLDDIFSLKSISHTISLVLSTNLLRVRSVSPVNSICHNTEPSATQLLTH